jgi:hypothetical protein
VNDQELGQREEQIVGRALHALDDIELDVADDPGVLEYHEVLSHLSFEEIAPPPALEARMLDAARTARKPDVPSLATRHRKTRRIVAVGAAGAVAAAVTLMLVVGGGSNATNTKAELASSPHENWSATLLERGNAQRFDLVDNNGTTVGHVVLSGSDGALDPLRLSPETNYAFALTGENGQRARVDDTVAAVAKNGFTFHGPVQGAVVIDVATGEVVARGMLDG